MSSNTTEQYDDDDIMMNLFESSPPTATTTTDDASVPSLSEDNEDDDDVVMEDISPETLGGLRNLGNTCYLNSATQMLASLDHFAATLQETAPLAMDKLELRNEFLELMTLLRRGETVHPVSFKKAVDSRSPLFVGYRQQDAHEFLTTLLDLLDEVYQQPKETRHETSSDEEKTKPEADEQSSAATDVSITDSIIAMAEESLCRVQSYSELKVSEISKLLHGDNDQKKPEQTPASATTKSNDEPQCKLIGGRAVVQDAKAPSLVAEASVSLPPTRPTTDTIPSTTTAISTPIDDYFCTEVRSRLTCDSCKYSRSQVEKYLHLSIDISSDDGSGVEEGLRKFFAPEKRDIKCEKCFCESATQSTEITKLPPALLFHFKRFIVDVSPDYSSVTYRKNQSAVEFTEQLSLEGVLREFMAEDATVGGNAAAQRYEIRSIVNHIGSSASCGHYTADSNRLYTGGERIWTRFNDSNVSRITPEEAMGKSTTKTAYMVLYELQ